MAGCQFHVELSVIRRIAIGPNPSARNVGIIRCTIGAITVRAPLGVAAAIRLAWGRKRSANDRACCKSPDHSAGTRAAVVAAMPVVAAIATMMAPLTMVTAMMAILHLFNVLDLRRRYGRDRHRRRCS